MPITMNLKRAGALAETAGKTSAGIALEIDAKVSVYTEADAVADIMRKAAEALTANTGRALALIKAQYAIRKLIGQANAQYGISDLMAEEKAAQLQFERLKELLERVGNGNAEGKTIEEAAKVAEASLPGARNRFEAGRGFEAGRAVSFGIVTGQARQDISMQMKLLSVRMQELKDEITGLNLTHKVTVPKDIADILRAEGLV